MIVLIKAYNRLANYEIGLTMSLTGECFCGSIKYEISGDVYDARSCHCSRCRKAFSGAGSAYGLVRGDFKWLAGEELLSSYVSEQGAGLQFCRQCGSTLTGVFQGEVHGVVLGCLNEDPPITMERHIFVGSKASWDTIGGDAPQYEAWPPEEKLNE